MTERRAIPPKTRKQVAERDRACVRCGDTGPYELDHIVEVKRGGTNDADNLQRLCVSCHKVETAAFAKARRIGRKHRPRVEGPTTQPDYGTAPKKRKVPQRSGPMQSRPMQKRRPDPSLPTCPECNTQRRVEPDRSDLLAPYWLRCRCGARWIDLVALAEFKGAR